MRGGKRANSGRKAGGKNSKPRLTAAVALRAAAEGCTPIEFLMAIMRDPDQNAALRVDCAKAALPYMHARLAPVEGAKPGHDEIIPLVDRLKAYARDEAIEASAGKVVSIK